MEILAPIKSLENAKIAIKKGADAIYLASPNFGARVNASIEIEEIENIIKIAKSNNVKTFITFNVVIFDNEIEKFFNEIDKINSFGATGIIIQDFSFIKEIKKRYPKLEIHASTQMNIHNTNAVNIIKELGVNQIVVPREMSFNKIHKLKENTNIKIEAFAHGALCVSYSGQCYDSTLLDQKSANRGRCSQYCRMPSKVYNKRTQRTIGEGYSLNLKDLNTISIIDKYKSSGVDVLKIEGRLKGIDYVGLTTEAYKNSVEGKDIDPNKLKEVYNRTFTKGLINSEKTKDLINQYRPNNNGIFIGKVKETFLNDNDNLKYYKYKILLELKEKIYKGDNLRFLSTKEEGQIVEKFEVIDNKVLLYSKNKINRGVEVYRTKNNRLIEYYTKEIEEITYKRKKVYVSLKIFKKEVTLEIEENRYSLNVEVFDALKHALSKDEVLDVMSKTKNTDYEIYVNNLEIEENIFVTKKNLKKIRDYIINKCLIKEEREFSLINDNTNNNIINSKKEKTYYFSLKNMDHLKYFIENKLSLNINIMISYSLIEKIEELGNFDLIKEIKKQYKVYLVLPRVLYDEKDEKIKELIKHFDNLCVSELGSLKYKELIKGDIITNFSLNTTNKINQSFLNGIGVDKQILSIELNKNKINFFDFDKSIINIYGAIPVMLMDYCPINSNKVSKCGTCRRCRNNDYSIKDNLNRTFPLVYEGDNKIGLYSEKKLGLFEELKELSNFNNFNLNLLDESEEEIDLVIKSLKNNKTHLKETFKGNFYKEVL